MLGIAKLNPQSSLATSSDFLNSHPTLQVMQRSLVESMQALAEFKGGLQPLHPKVQSRARTVQAIHDQIHQEIESLSRTVESDISVAKSRIVRLEGLAQRETDRLVSLGASRVDHLTINAEVVKKQELLLLAQAELAEVQSLRLATGKVNWLTRIDLPQVGTRPDGMGKKSTVIGGAMCGLMLGIGLLMLIAPPMEGPMGNGQPDRLVRQSELPVVKNGLASEFSVPRPPNANSAGPATDAVAEVGAKPEICPKEEVAANAEIRSTAEIRAYAIRPNELDKASTGNLEPQKRTISLKPNPGITVGPMPRKNLRPADLANSVEDGLEEEIEVSLREILPQSIDDVMASDLGADE